MAQRDWCPTGRHGADGRATGWHSAGAFATRACGPVVADDERVARLAAGRPGATGRATTIAAHIFQVTQLPWRMMEQQKSCVQSILTAQASTPAQTSIFPPTRKEKMDALQSATLPPPATGRPGARGATVATTGAATDEQPAKAPSAKLGRKERQYSEEQVRAPGSVASRA